MTEDVGERAAEGTRELGSTGIPVSSLGLDGSIFGWDAGIEETPPVLDAFLESGGTLVSTADHYAGGRSEVMIGQWLQSREARQKVVLATKVGRHPDAAGLSPESLRRAIAASLERLRTGRIDILSFDGLDPEADLGAALDVVAECLAEGTVGALGLSRVSGRDLERVSAEAEARGVPGPGVVLAEYSLLARGALEQDLGPAARRVGAGTIARLPLARGYLYGRDLPVDGSAMFEAASRHAGTRGETVRRVVEEIADDHAVSPAVVAVAWVLARRPPDVTLLRAREAAQIHALVGARDLVLSGDEMARLDEASEGGETPHPDQASSPAED